MALPAPETVRPFPCGPNGSYAGSGEEGDKEFHYDWVNDYPGSSDDLKKCDNDARGLRDALTSDWIWWGHGDDNAEENHMKRNDIGGGDNGSHLDIADLVYFSGHGIGFVTDSYFGDSVYAVNFANDEDDEQLLPSDARAAWGDGDAEWVALSASKVLESGGRCYWSQAMTGLHAVFGFSSSPLDANYGSNFGQKMKDSGWGDSAWTMCEAWFYAAEKKNSSGTAAGIFESSSNMNDYLWGQGSVSSDPTNNDYETVVTYSLSSGSTGSSSCSGEALAGTSAGGVVSRVAMRAREHGLTVRVPAAGLPETPETQMRVFLVQPVQVDEPFVRAIADSLCVETGAFCGGDVGPADPNELGIIDGLDELRVTEGTGSFVYVDRGSWLVHRQTKPQVLEGSGAIQRANELLAELGLRPPGAFALEVEYLVQAETLDGIEIPEQTFATASRVEYQRRLLQGQFPVGGAGGRLYVELGENGQLQRIHKPGWRPLVAGQLVDVRPLSEVIQDIASRGMDALVDGVKQRVKEIRIDSFELGYYEPDGEEPLTELRPVYILHSTLIGENGEESAVDLHAWADVAKPAASILSPPDGTQVASGTQVCFSGSAQGGVPPYELRWEDELGNTLGTDVAPCATLLADFDPHAQTSARTVTLIVTDALGRESQQHIRVFVQGEGSYCTAKVNSCGSTPEIGSLGLPSASASSGFVVTASHARGGKLGFVLYSDAGRFAAPFQGGTLCLRAPIRRTTSFISSGNPGACDGAYSVDMNAFAAGLLGGNPQAFLQVPGTRVNCQVWGRDTQQHGSYLSDGLEYVIRE